MRMIKRIKNKVLKYIFKVRISKSINHDSPPSIISSNCIGGRIYKVAGLSYRSPTVGLWFEADDFYRFVTRLRYYLSLDLKLDSYSDDGYPIGKIGDVKIHFMHYKSFDDAFKSWNRRALRVNINNVVILNTDRDGCEKSKLIQLHQDSPYRIVSFVAKDIEYSSKYIVKVEAYTDDVTVGDLYTDYQHLAFKFPYEIFKNG
ncbi:TPA: DUF1919 domain-containing protein [Vibrio vulnificus]|nr:DUF1919 domain-containing protein [Vibrio vulnificus]